MFDLNVFLFEKVAEKALRLEVRLKTDEEEKNLQRSTPFIFESSHVNRGLLPRSPKLLRPLLSV